MGEAVLGNRYQIIRKIGDGGMAFVYEAKDRLLNRTVALKVLRPEFVDDQEFLAKFKREAEAVASLSHPNIVNVYDVGEDGKVHYIVMEYIDGQNLKEIIQNEGTLDEYTALDITKQIAQALSAAHRKGIIHRDIKPHNILISNEGRVVKVADFGIAKATSSSTATNIGSVIGSVHYFSPEQAKGKFVTNSADLYSLGIVLYEMLLGKVPFRGDSPISIALQHINDDIDFTADEKVAIPQSIRTLIKKMTEKAASDRYQTAEELIEDIDYIEKNIDLDFIKEYNDFETKKIDPDQINRINKSISERLDPTPIDDMEDDYDDYYEDDYYEDDYEDDEDDYEDDEMSASELRKERKRQKKLDKKNKKKKSESPKTRKRLKVLAVVLVLILATQVFAFYKFLGPSLGWGTSTGQNIAPDLINMSIDDARSKLDKMGVSIRVKSSEFSESIDENCIISQTPESGTELKKGDEVVVVLSKGSGVTEVPSIVGLKLSEAREVLDSHNLKLGTVKYEYSSKKEGVVLSQSPKAGAKNLQQGDTINVVVSKVKDEPAKVEPTQPETPVIPEPGTSGNGGSSSGGTSNKPGNDTGGSGSGGTSNKPGNDTGGSSSGGTSKPGNDTGGSGTGGTGGSGESGGTGNTDGGETE